jgi:Mn-dependent DtxR family transcriptional regulator
VPLSTSKTSTSAEDYLERIHELITEKGYARAVDIANALGISQPSVTSMVQKLANEGLLNYEKYRGLTLTEEGKRVALAIHARHEILKRFLSLLNVSQKAQDLDIEGLEHHISDETVQALSKVSDHLEAHAGELDL